MALSRTTLVSAVSAEGLGTAALVSGSFTPPDNSLIVVVGGAMAGSGAADPSANLTMAGGGLTFTRQVFNGTGTDFGVGLAIWTAPVTTGASMTLTLDCGATSLHMGMISAVAYTGYDTGTPAGATGTGSATPGDGAQSLTLSGAPATASEVVAGIVFDKESVGCTQGSAFTEIHDLQIGAAGGLETEVRTGSTSTTVDWVDTHTGTGSVFKTAFAAVEIEAAADTTVDAYQAVRRAVFPTPRLMRTGSLQPLQLAGDRSTGGTPTSVNLSDTGTGSDDLTVSATIALSDTGTGSDVLTVTVTTPLADTGTGSDSLAITAAIPAADTGTGSDSLSVNGSIPVGDTGSGSDGLSIAATVPFSDTGSGSDALAIDAPGAVDQYQAGQQIAWMFLDLERSSFQSLGSAEAAASTTPNLPDSGLATDGLVVTAAIVLADTGTGADALSVTAAVSLSDTGTGTDTLSVTATVALSDTGAGSDSLSVNVTVGLGDTGSGSDSLSAAATVPLADTGTGTDALTITVTAPLSDTATSADVLTALDASQPDPYQATIRTEGWNLLRPSPVTLQSLGDRSGSTLIALSDTGTSSDALSVDVSLPGSDTGTGSDSLSITAAAALTDAGTATDSLSITVTVSLSDTAAAADVLAAVRVFTTTDTGAGADALVASVVAPLSETASGVEALAITAAGSLVEIATATDSLSVAIFVPKALADTAAAVEALSIFVGLVGGTLTGGQVSGASVIGSTAQEQKIVGQVRSGYVTGGVR